MNNRIPSEPPKILPLNMHPETRPLWSVMIPAYNCIKYLQHTLESVLQQDPGEDVMQIEVVDDCSTDGDVEALVKEIGKGRVNFYKQEENKGSLRNFETCLNRSQGTFVHLLHGDDMVKVGFYNEIEGLFRLSSDIGAAFTNYSRMDENGAELEPYHSSLPGQSGIIDNFVSKIAQFCYLQTPSIVVKRSVYEKLGSFFAVHYGEDWEMWIRIAAHYPIAFSPRYLAVYREGNSQSISGQSLSSGQNIRDIAKVIDIAQNYLPGDRKKELRRAAERNFSILYAGQSNKIYLSQRDAAFIQAREALKLNVNIRSLYWVLRLYIIHFINTVRNFRYRRDKWM